MALQYGSESEEDAALAGKHQAVTCSGPSQWVLLVKKNCIDFDLAGSFQFLEYMQCRFVAFSLDSLVGNRIKRLLLYLC